MKIVPAYVDQKLLFMLVALIGIGLVLVFSASSATSLDKYHDKFYVVKIQCAWICLGLSLMMVFLSVDYHKLRALSTPGIIFTLALLILVLLPGVGRTVHGATRWVMLGPIRVQPAEITKLAVILYLADILSKNYKRRDSFVGYVLPNLALITFIALLVVKQRALSSASLVMAIGFLMLLVGYANLGQILSLCGLGMVAVAGLIYTEPYRLRRLTAFFDPWADANGSGYQIIQSLMALGSGGVSGVGIGQGVQKIRYLPFVNTDFIFAVLGEELGLVGGLLVMVLFLGILYRGIRIALRAPDLFGMFLAFGITLAIVLQAFLNMAVVTGMMPVTGVTLPFISYGGSSMVYTLVAFGILLNISRAAEKDTYSKMSRRWSAA
jgi:cell division protein FtsW